MPSFFLAYHFRSRTVNNVYAFVAEQSGYKNNNISGSQIPLFNLSGVQPGPFNPNPSLVTPFPPVNSNAAGASGRGVFGVCQDHGKGKGKGENHC
jgi:hypothetical protein